MFFFFCDIVVGTFPNTLFFLKKKNKKKYINNKNSSLFSFFFSSLSYLFSTLLQSSVMCASSI